jgi:hypothetical protein
MVRIQNPSQRGSSGTPDRTGSGGSGEETSKTDLYCRKEPFGLDLYC